MLGIAARQKLKVIRRAVLFTLIAMTVVGGLWGTWRYHGPAPEKEIFQGVYYGCERVADTPQSGGLMHWIRADLNVPGVSLYVTPLDLEAEAKGFEYKLRHVSTAVIDDHLAAAVNGTLFFSDSTLIRLPGDLAISNETVVADHVMNHIHKHSYLMWWDDNMMAHQQRTKPPTPAVIAKTKWGISGQQPILYYGALSGNLDPDWRTVIAADPDRHLVWIACFDWSSFRFAAKTMADHGAKIAVSVDGGTSMAMSIGTGARNVRSGTVTGNWRPVATQFGFRALPLP